MLYICLFADVRICVGNSADQLINRSINHSIHYFY